MGIKHSHPPIPVILWTSGLFRTLIEIRNSVECWRELAEQTSLSDYQILVEIPTKPLNDIGLRNEDFPYVMARARFGTLSMNRTSWGDSSNLTRGWSATDPYTVLSKIRCNGICSGPTDYNTFGEYTRTQTYMYNECRSVVHAPG